MTELIFIIGMGMVAAGSLWWGFRHLPREQWQIMAVLPRRKKGQGWQGLNLTYYGVLCANAYTFAVVVFLILTTAARISLPGLCVFITAVLAVCLPASRIIARVVEKKKGTLTVGGAVFVGILVSPPLVLLINRIFEPVMAHPLHPLVLLSAVSIAYAFGEGLGRLACISFGCCYGKPLDQCPPIIQALFSRFYLVFTGPLKKITYASGYDGQKVLPVQIITAALYTGTGLAGTILFLNGLYRTAFLITLAVTQIWRFVSEFFRADFRGGMAISAYQVMALVTLGCAGAMALLLPVDTRLPLPRLHEAVSTLWNPWMILFVQGIWAAAFLHTGRSVVTGSSILFHVEKTRI
ncbi:MAG: prolipoprotein diacylglyceryl transferase family protein [Desulfotignum sp.]